MGNRECQKERWGTFCIMTLLCIAFMVVNLVDFPGLGSTVYAASVPQGAYDPDTYQGITYTIHGNNGSYGTKEVDKVFDNVFYYKDVIVVEDTDITANGEGNSYSFSLISYDATETVSNGFVTLKTLEDKGIVRITDGTVLDDTLSDSMKGQTTIQRIEFINPNCVVMFAISRSDSSHPCYSGSKMKDGKSYAGVVACIDYATVYATSCEVSYSYTGLESDYLWQDGVKSQLPQTLYLPIPGCSYQFTIPLPAISGRYTSISLSEIIDSRVFSLFTNISQEEASSLASLKERMVTVAFANDASGTKGSLYSEGNIQIHKGKIQVEFSSSNGTTVNFHQNGGTLSGIADGSDYYVARVLYNTTYTAEEIDALASTPSRAGYQFAGWRMKDPGRYEYSILMEDVTEVQEGCYKVSSYQFTMVPAVLDLYAFWTKEQQTYTVTFHANGHGTAPKAQTVAEGEKASRPATPTASGYVFDGWYREAACKNAYDFDTIVTSDIDLYAKWTQITAPTPTPTPEVGDPIIIEQGPKILTAVAKKNKVTVTWKAIKNNTAGKKLLKKIKSIQIQSATNKKFTKNVQSKSISVKKTKATLKLSRKTTYYIRMRYVGKVGGFSLWGNVKKVKTQ